MDALIELPLGSRWGHWTVIGPAQTHIQQNGRHRIAYPCRCDCGAEKNVLSAKLRNGRSRSCGCQKSKLTTVALQKYDLSTPELRGAYRSWHSMRERCLNSRIDPRHANYRRRGIKICERWIDSFENFLSDMGPRPLRHSIERLDNDGGYTPGNCIWATAEQQARNTTKTVRVSFEGELLPLRQVAARIGVSYGKFYARYRLRGRDIEAAVNFQWRKTGSREPYET